MPKEYATLDRGSADANAPLAAALAYLLLLFITLIYYYYFYRFRPPVRYIGAAK
jgi:hypothetical protein